jgi:hypothetical protein
MRSNGQPTLIVAERTHTSRLRKQSHWIFPKAQPNIPEGEESLSAVIPSERESFASTAAPGWFGMRADYGG